MKILVSLFVYNERKYLPAFIEYYKSQGCSILVIDNYSIDGTFEYLQKHKIRVFRCNTNGAFHLRKLQDALTHQISRYRPDWVVYAGADLYYSFDKSIRETIAEVDAKGYNQITVRHLEAMNTGEPGAGTLQEKFLYGVELKYLTMISKFKSGFFIIADELRINDPKPITIPGIVINYGACKPKAEQEQKLQRRQKAWREGLHQGWGTHYVAHKKREWIWGKGELLHFPDTPHWPYIRQIQKQSRVK